MLKYKLSKNHFKNLFFVCQHFRKEHKSSANNKIRSFFFLFTIFSLKVERSCYTSYHIHAQCSLFTTVVFYMDRNVPYVPTTLEHPNLQFQSIYCQIKWNIFSSSSSPMCPGSHILAYFCNDLLLPHRKARGGFQLKYLGKGVKNLK